MSIDLNEALGAGVSVSDGYFGYLEGVVEGKYFDENEVSKGSNSDAAVKEVFCESNHDGTGVEIEKSFEIKHDESENLSYSCLKQDLGEDLDEVNYDGIRVDIEKSLEVGSVIETLDETYILYCEYARRMGFSVKKGQQIYFQRCDVVKMKLYLCSYEGVPDHKSSVDKVAVFKKQMWRTNCRARLRLSRRKNGPWTVSRFHKVHNHNLLAPDQSYLLRSARNLSHAKLSVIATLKSAGIRVSKAFQFMEKECGGLQNIGFIRKDAYNNIGHPRQETKIKNVDAQRVLHYLDQRASEDPLFRWSAQLDDNGRLMNFFYQDARCAMDYNLFGDVLSVDTTHKTNKYNLICAPFVGMNHHRQNVLFGVGFLSDETTESFEWLFSTFLKHVEMKEPQVVFSNQCQTLINGIDYTFQTAKHRLCQWHINRNATGHFGLLNGSEQFKRTWYRCMNCCETEDEFEENWRDMIEIYNLSGHGWFKKIYNLKRRWASVFSIDRFSGGLRATSWSESANKTLKSLCNACTCLYDFVIQYEQVLVDCRHRERASDANCEGLPGYVVVNNQLLNHAADVYTRKVFNLFHKEFEQASNVYMYEHPPDYSADDLIFHVRVNGFRKGRIVTVQKSKEVFECSCCKFITHGLICNHIISIMQLLNVRRLPGRYILNHWTKNAKDKTKKLVFFSNGGDNTRCLRKIVFVNHVMRLAYEVALTCKDDIDMSKFEEAMVQMKSQFCDGNLETTKTPKKSVGPEPVKVGGVAARNPDKHRSSPKDKGKDIDKAQDDKGQDEHEDEENPEPNTTQKETRGHKRKAKSKAGQPVSVYLNGSINQGILNPRRSSRNRKGAKAEAGSKIEDISPDNKSMGLPNAQEEEISRFSDGLGLDFFPTQQFSLNVSSLPVMPHPYERLMNEEEIKLTL